MEYTIATLVNSGAGVVNAEKCITDLKKYTANDITKDSANAYLESLRVALEGIENSGANDLTKSYMKKGVMMYMTQAGISDCLRELVSALDMKNKQLLTSFQAERDDYNELAKKAKANQKSAVVEAPNITLSITRNNKKKITDDDIIAIMNNIDSNALNNEKFTRVSASGNKSVGRVFAKKGGNQTFIKN